MNTLQMKTEIDALSVRLAARRALVRSFTCVRLLVGLEMSELRVGIVADRTDIRLLTGVSPHVHCQCILVDESLRHTNTVVVE